MGATQQALLMGGGFVAALNKVAVDNGFPGSTFSTTSTSYVDLLDGSGGSPISTSIQKGGPTGLLVAMGLSCNVATSTQIFLGVSVGGTDYDVGKFEVDAAHKTAAGELLIPNLPAGTFTITARIKIVGSTAINFTSVNAGFVRAKEVA